MLKSSDIELMAELESTYDTSCFPSVARVISTFAERATAAKARAGAGYIDMYVCRLNPACLMAQTCSTARWPVGEAVKLLIGKRTRRTT
jgi:hypothetical protein